jgi:hypothetical protein
VSEREGMAHPMFMLVFLLVFVLSSHSSLK